MKELFAGEDYIGGSFHLFGQSHLIALGVIVLINLALIYFRTHFTQSHRRRRFRYGLAIVLLANETAYHLWRLATGQWTIQIMLPLHLCAVMVYLSAIMLITKSYTLYQFLYFMGIGGATQALLTPDAGIYGFPHFRFFEIFISHGAIVTAAIYMTVVERYRPYWKSILRVAVWLNVYMAFVGIVNALIGSNYMYIARKPDIPTLIDVLGPWPWYILPMEAIGLAVCLLLYLPFAIWDMMKNFLKVFFVCIVFVCVMPQAGQPCSTFCLDHNGQPVFGRNYDWMVEDALVIVNKRHVSKVAATGAHPASWTSKYGSLTFNQYGHEFTHGGINEAGLVVENMWLDATEYPAPDARPTLDNLQWAQYQLDNFSTVAEVIASDSQIRITPNGAKIHYLICDSTGACASIEFLEGKMVVHTGETMPFNVLTNNTYAESVEFLKQHEGFGGTLPIADTNASLDRFARVANLLKHYDPSDSGSAIEYAFGILTNVAQGDRTKWSIVYDIPKRRIYFRTLTNPQLRYVDLNAFDFSCKTPIKVLDINAGKSGDVTNDFVDYTFQLNRTLVGNAFKKTGFTANIPDEMLDLIAHYPESTVCTEYGW
jgi:hypothetical integral membrane protein (TIGR02206 family)